MADSYHQHSSYGEQTLIKSGKRLRIWVIRMNLSECGIFTYRIVQVVLRLKPSMYIKLILPKRANC